MELRIVITSIILYIPQTLEKYLEQSTTMSLKLVI